MLKDEFNLKVGQEILIEGEDLRVAFSAVVEDSRCPRGANCLWEGNGRIAVSLRKGDGAPVSAELNTTLEPQQSSCLGYEVSLKRLHPYPHADSAIGAGDYVATLSISSTTGGE